MAEEEVAGGGEDGRQARATCHHDGVVVLPVEVSDGGQRAMA